MITIFTPSFADEANTNAQNLSAKEIISRLPADRFRVIMLSEGGPDPRILSRENTELLRWSRRGNTMRLLPRLLFSKIDIYFFPRPGPLETAFLFCRSSVGLSISLVTYIVMALDEVKVEPGLERLIRVADRVLGNSRFVSQTVQDRFAVPTATIHSGIKRDVFYPATAARTGGPPLTALYAGSFQARKRVDLVIREAAKWPAVEFRLVGKGEEEGECRTLVRELGCQNVAFVGHLPQQELAEEMRRADVFLFPSILEGHPQVLGQAASCGLPAIAMEKYRPDYVVNGETGYLVKSDIEFSEKLGLLLTNYELRRKMSASAARHSLQFDWDKIARDWEQVFVEAAAKRRKKR